MKTKRVLSSFILGLTALAASASIAAAGYPEKAITVIVPFPPGGSSDAIARAIGPRITQTLGQPWVVDNRPGATGAIGAGLVKRAAPDGHTLMVASIGVYSVNPVLQKKMQYDPSRDFDLLTVAVRAPNVLVASPNVPAKNMAELVAWLKNNPEKVSFASSGNGSSDHLTAALFWQKTGTSGLHVPYKGGAPAMTDLLGGQVDVSFVNVNTALTYIKAGKLKALAVTGDKRSAVLPQVPTLAEAGIKGVDIYSWQGIAAPKGLSKEVKAKLHHSILAALNEPVLKAKLTEQGFEVVGNTPEQFARFQAEELARWRNVIEVGKITLE
ncbi:Bug family tripartite tricarboxylate transporter substrate binding protein [Massilia cavernae]|uniref:Tripartite tricarboxylate transporter substrate binding protein n=1 Tax=Massilia cavernae TaxID=2320864 RepID=A0A418XY21_9BURK|nr:tripartite tricarboxylate transporter substrate binding protein [Massilia cavernae]RJG17871.1 tripartite tricarboxylate transporter substrate binding protein [Massilia cavernae]